MDRSSATLAAIHFIGCDGKSLKIGTKNKAELINEIDSTVDVSCETLSSILRMK